MNVWIAFYHFEGCDNTPKALAVFDSEEKAWKYLEEYTKDWEGVTKCDDGYEDTFDNRAAYYQKLTVQ